MNNCTSPATSFEALTIFLASTSLVGLLIQGLAPRRLLKAVPQPVVLLVVYIVIGVVLRIVDPQGVENGLDAAIDPEAIQALFLPILMFSELFRLNARAFFVVLNQLLLLIGPGVVLGAFLTALFPWQIMPSRPRFSFQLAMSFGAMLSTTDPIAIIITINELAAPRRVAAVVGGESLLNDGTSIVLVTLFLDLQRGGQVDTGEVVYFIFNQLVFSVLFGIGMGAFSVAVIRIVRNDANTLTSLMVIMPFFTFILSAYYLESSGVLSIIPLGIILNVYGRSMIYEHVARIEQLFDQLNFIATGWLYGVSGLVVGTILASSSIKAEDWASLFCLYVWINLVRILVIFLFLPALQRLGYGFNPRESFVLAWGGLRGAVGLTLAMSIERSPGVSSRDGSLVAFFMAGSILLMLINGISTPYVLKYLRLDSKPNDKLIHAIQTKMSGECLTALLRAGCESEQAHVLAFGCTEDEYQGVSPPASDPSHTDEASTAQHQHTGKRVQLNVLQEQRRHVVSAQRRIYGSLLSRNLLTREGWYILDRAADQQLENNQFSLDQFRYVVDGVAKRVKILTKISEMKGCVLCCSNSSTTRNSTVCCSNHSKSNRVSYGLLHYLFTHATEDVGSFLERQYGVTGMDAQEEVQSLDETTLLGVEDDIEGAENQCLPGLFDHQRSFGMNFTAEDWVYQFLAASWGFIYAQQDSKEVIAQMFTIKDWSLFQNERNALETEIGEGCTLPAMFINAVA